jgi:Mg-chelatase subunit ChlD
MASIVPTFTPPNPQDTDPDPETVENEKPEELDAIQIAGQAEKDNVFIFIVDRSGSMSGQKMEMTKEALKLFIQSLPLGS